MHSSRGSIYNNVCTKNYILERRENSGDNTNYNNRNFNFCRIYNRCNDELKRNKPKG